MTFVFFSFFFCTFVFIGLSADCCYRFTVCCRSQMVVGWLVHGVFWSNNQINEMECSCSDEMNEMKEKGKGRRRREKMVVLAAPQPQTFNIIIWLIHIPLSHDSLSLQFVPLSPIIPFFFCSLSWICIYWKMKIENLYSIGFSLWWLKIVLFLFPSSICTSMRMMISINN